MSYPRFDIPSAITDNHKIKLNIVVDGDSTLNSGISIQEYGQTGWGESPNSKNIGIIRNEADLNALGLYRNKYTDSLINYYIKP